MKNGWKEERARNPGQWERLTGLCLWVGDKEGKGCEESEEEDVNEEVAEVDVAAVSLPLVVEEAGDQGVLEKIDLGRVNLFGKGREEGERGGREGREGGREGREGRERGEGGRGGRAGREEREEDEMKEGGRWGIESIGGRKR